MGEVIGLTIRELIQLDPCSGSRRRVSKLLKDFNPNEGHRFTVAEAREAGCTFNDIVWAASAVSHTDREVERRLRHWMADCATRVLHLYERDHPSDMRVRDAIKAARAYADGRIDDAKRAGKRAAALAAMRAVKREAALAAMREATREAAWAAARAAGLTATEWLPALNAARAAAWIASWAVAKEAEREAAWAAARAEREKLAAKEAEEAFQFDRLILWLSLKPPKPLRLPPKPKMMAFLKKEGE